LAGDAFGTERTLSGAVPLLFAWQSDDSEVDSSDEGFNSEDVDELKGNTEGESTDDGDEVDDDDGEAHNQWPHTQKRSNVRI
jgi:hypothetical protein